MILYGVRVRTHDPFSTRCLPSLIANGGPDARILTTLNANPIVATNELLEQARTVSDFEALVLLDSCVEITDPTFPAHLRYLIRQHPQSGLLRPGDPNLAEHLAVLTPGAVTTARLTEPEEAVGRQSADRLLQQWASASGAGLAEFARPGARIADAIPTMERLTHIIAAAKQSEWSARISDQLLAQVKGTNEPSLAMEIPSPRESGTTPSSESGPAALSADRPELLCHVPRDATAVLIIGHEPAHLAERVTAGTGAVVSTLISPGGPLLPSFELSLPAPAPLPLPESTFDAILLVDALAHVRDPRQLLQRLIPLLTKTGRVIAAVPNARHWSHVLPLLLNDQLRFGGGDLLARNAPVRWFTLVETMLMFDEAGLTTYEFCNGTRYPGEDPPQLDGLLAWAASCGINADDARTMLTCYHYVVVARKGD